MKMRPEGMMLRVILRNRIRRDSQRVFFRLSQFCVSVSVAFRFFRLFCFIPALPNL